MIIKGNKHVDGRGILCYNNGFDASQIKRIYTIENANVNFIRGWQGHRIEQRWFAAISGSFKISVIKVDNWEKLSKDLTVAEHVLDTDSLDFLHVDAGHITAIQALEENSKLLVMADHLLGETQDEYSFPLSIFKN